MPVRIGRRFSIGTDGDPELEVWEWNTEMDSLTGSDEGAVDIEEVDRAHRWNLLASRQLQRPVCSSSLWRARQQQLDSATSRTSSVLRSTHQRHPSDPGLIIPCHHKCIPLSFIASLLLVDKSTIGLLTHASSESALFPGHSYLDEQPTDEHNETPHGATKLFADLEGDRTLLEGLAVACDPEFIPFNPFALPSLQLSGLWSIVNGVWRNGGRAWRDVWT